MLASASIARTTSTGTLRPCVTTTSYQLQHPPFALQRATFTSTKLYLTAKEQSKFALRKPDSVSEKRWAAVQPHRRHLLSHIGYINETDWGERADSPCTGCASSGKECRVYIKEADSWTPTCSRCRSLGLSCSHNEFTRMRRPNREGTSEHDGTQWMMSVRQALLMENRALREEVAKLREENDCLRKQEPSSAGKAPSGTT